MQSKPDPYEWVAEKLDLCYKVCNKVCRKRIHLVDDMFSEVVLEYIPRIIDCWKPELSTLTSHVRARLRMYGSKWLNHPQTNRASLIPGKSTVPLDKVDTYQVDETTSIEEADNVEYLMRSLTGYERRVVSLHVLWGLTFADIAKKVGVNKDKIAKVYQEAISKCVTTNT